MRDGGGGHWLVWMEWRPAGWSACLPLLIFPCTIKSRSSRLAPAHPGGPGKRAVKRLWCDVVKGCVSVFSLPLFQTPQLNRFIKNHSLVASFYIFHKLLWQLKNWVVRYWRGYLSVARCKWFAYDPADANAPVKSRMITFLVTAYPGCPGKKAVKRT